MHALPKAFGAETFGLIAVWHRCQFRRQLNGHFRVALTRSFDCRHLPAIDTRGRDSSSPLPCPLISRSRHWGSMHTCYPSSEAHTHAIVDLYAVHNPPHICFRCIDATCSIESIISQPQPAMSKRTSRRSAPDPPSVPEPNRRSRSTRN